MARDLSPISSSSRRSDRPADKNTIWLRITAFLSTRSPNTQRSYRAIVEEWCQFLRTVAGTPEAAEALIKATDLHSSAYRAWLGGKPGQRSRMESRPTTPITKAVSRERRGRSTTDGAQHTQANATIAKKFAALRRIYRMLIASDLGITNNPFDSDRVPAPSPHSGRKRPTEMVDFKLVKQIVSSPDNQTAKGRRDRALLAVLFGGGLRRGEVVKLRIADVRRSQAGTIYLRLRATKAKRDADQALPSWAAEYLFEILRDRAKDNAQSGDYLFVSFRGKGGAVPTSHPLSSHGLYQLFKHYCRLAGAGDFVSPHSARATAITKLLADGIPHREVQEFSRHASVQMVEVYDKRRLGVDQNPGKDLDYE